MRFLACNLVSILLLILAGYMIYADRPYSGLVIFAAIICALVPCPSNSKDK